MMTPSHILKIMNNNHQYSTIKIRVWGQKPKKGDWPTEYYE